MVTSLAVVAMEELARFSSSFNAGVAECPEFFCPEVVCFSVNGGGGDVDIENRDVVVTLSDVEA